MDGGDTTEVTALPQPFPGYELIRPLGQGGMARVYLAREESLDRLVAIKVMSDALLSGDFIERFAIEAKTAAQFRHPNIVVVHASGRADDQPYIVFEYIAGGDLERRLDAEEALAEATAVDIASKITAALSYLHERKVVHRDIKPGNILFNKEGVPILADFGIAMDLASDERLTRAGTLIGSPRYMSPEQLRGGSVTDKSDMYSLGLVLLEMLGGRFPKDANPTEFLSQAGKYEPLVAELLASNPEDRPTAEESLVRLQAHSQALSASVGVSRRWYWAAAGVAAVSLVAFLNWDRSKSPNSLTVQINATPAQAKLYLNGEPQNNRLISAIDEPQELVVVAPGFVGRSMSVSTATAETIQFDLEPLGVPSAQQFTDFHAAFDDASMSAERLQEITIGYPPYDQLLQLRAAIARDTAAASDSLIALAARADAGDAAAQLGAFLLASEGLADFQPSRTKLWLNNASARGAYSLASFYRALDFQDQQELIGSFGKPEFEEYSNLLELAKTQGLPFGRAELLALSEAIE